ncbi:MAG: PIN domain-containing protein [Actinomycetia bacterium]|nr:PIN domain-containing protein [Actinomycetes bacterium]
MIVADVNVLLAAHFESHPHHSQAHPWLVRALANDGDPVVVPDLVWVGFVRLATNPRVFDPPSTLTEAMAFVSAVLGAPGYQSMPGLLDGVGQFLAVCRSALVPSRLVTDAYIAAVAIAHACPVATFDRDFRRFDGLDTIIPTADRAR